MLTTLIQDSAERDRLFSATSTIPAIKAKAEWTMRWIEDKHQPFAVRLIAFAAVEGIFFSSSFAAIFWLRSRGLLPGICHSNELIARDESMHTMFACLLYSQLQTRAPKATVRAVIREAVALEKSFFAGTLHSQHCSTNGNQAPPRCTTHPPGRHEHRADGRLCGGRCRRPPETLRLPSHI